MLTIVDNKILFLNLPIPVSENQMYCNSRNGRGLGRFPSGKLKLFQKQMSEIKFDCSQLTKAKFLLSNKRLRATYSLYFEPSRLIGKKGQVKKLDTANYIKCLQDAVCRILDIDDMFIFELFAVKQTARDPRKEGSDVLLEIIGD